MAVPAARHNRGEKLNAENLRAALGNRPVPHRFLLIRPYDADRIARVVAYQTIIVEELLKCGKHITINGKDYADMSSNC